ncbi:hypothetical protein [Solilutibacter silvestris]|uniref:Uncharacterized protein n=1 Tax=Solilutibacter silvestris TaxID=1645665 RepID=A0A2K1Q428_9GAMM|nr:hypothetical protein [Lysobacter silvestris]PNS09812.1 hypothetical protein Lysil_1441 [Lysobacter silvestris]
MRTLIIVAIGIALSALLLMLFRRNAPTLRAVFATFAVAWVAVCGYNLWLGVTRAGYAVMEELPFFLANAGVPVLFAWWLQRRLQRPLRA